MYLINGEFKQEIDVADRGFQYGDGLFETIEVNEGRLVFYERHLNRLFSGCRRLQIPCPDSKKICSEANDLAKNSTRAVLKIVVTRGSGGRGYRRPEITTPTRVLSLHPYPEYPRTYWEQGITVRFCSTRLGLNPALAGLKHLNRLEQVMARAEWSDATIQEGLMLDISGNVIEGTMTNLFYVYRGSLFTSVITQSGVAGIIRQIILEQAAINHLNCFEHLFGVPELLQAEEIFVCNSIIGLWPVTRIESHHFALGSVTRRITDWLGQYKQHWMQQC